MWSTNEETVSQFKIKEALHMIKYCIVMMVFILCLTPLYAQEHTLISGEIESGGFGGPVVKIGPMNGSTGILFGGRGGWIINHTFSIGGAGYGLVNNIKMTDPSGLGRTLYLDFGYGGLELEYTGGSWEVIHYTLGVLIGGGGITYRDSINQTRYDRNVDRVFVMEPTASVELNITTFFRINAGVTYRWVNDVQFAGLKNSDFSGMTGMLTLKFGGF